MRRAALGLAVVVLALAGCGGAEYPAPTPRAQPTRDAAAEQDKAAARAVVQDYLDAIARGDGEAACRLVDPALFSDTGDYRTRAECARDLSDAPRELGRFPIVDVQIQSPNEIL